MKFITGLMDGKLLSARSLALMMSTVKNDHGEPVYGLGLSYLQAGGIEAWGQRPSTNPTNRSVEKDLIYFPIVDKIAISLDQLLDDIKVIIPSC